MTARLSRAIAMAAEAHAGQVDKAGAPYILHPLRIMLTMSGEDERIVAMLHDVVEDCPSYPLARIYVTFDETIETAVDALTKRHGESYDDYLRRVAGNPLARAVKMADLADNADVRRFTSPTDDDRARCERYRQRREMLEGMR